MGFKAWYDEHIVSRLIVVGASQPPIMERRAEVVPLASGRVFEIGCGGGLNQRFYDRDKVTGFAGLDPSGKLREYATAEARKKGWDADIRHGYGENIPFADEEFDSVVCTFTLCSVSDAPQVLSEMRRILKPGGRLLFLEHGRAPEASVRKWQRRIEPVWKRALGNCHLTRPIGDAIRGAGFSVRPVGEGYLPKGPKLASWMEWGEAVKAGE